MIFPFIHPVRRSTERSQTIIAQAIHSFSDERWSFDGNDRLKDC